MLPPPARWAFACLGLLLAACSAGPDDDRRCVMDQVADLDVLNGTSVPVVRVEIGGKPFDFIVDTGAFFSTISPPTLRALGLKADTSESFVAFGVNGRFSVAPVTIDHLELGGGSARHVTLMVNATEGTATRPDRSPNLFGADFLSNYDVELDLPSRKISLYTEEACTAGFPQPWDGPAYRMTFSDPGRKIVLSVAIDGHPVPMELDSGSSITVLRVKAAAAVGVTPDRLRGDRAFLGLAADGSVRPRFLHRFASMTIGPERIVDPWLAVGDIRTISLLGDDFLRHHRVWISYPHREIWVQPVGRYRLSRIEAAHP